jgi:hypothetical protein
VPRLPVLRKSLEGLLVRRRAMAAENGRHGLKRHVVLRNRVLWDDYGYVRKNLLCTFETYYHLPCLPMKVRDRRAKKRDTAILAGEV